MRLSKFLAIFSIFSILLIFTGCSEEKSEPEVTPLRVGASITFPPFGFRDESERGYQGFDVDLIRAIAKELGRPIQLSGISFDGLIPTILSKNVDVALSGITINEERQKSIMFSDPYFESGLQIVVREGDTSINSLEDLKGKTIAVQLGTTSNALAKTIDGATIHELDNPLESFDELKAGIADAVINDRPSNAFLLSRGKISNVRIIPELLTREEYGIAMPKDQIELRQQINDALKKVRESGEYDRIYAKWFGAQTPQQ